MEPFREKGLITKDPMLVTLENGSTIRFGGLDDNERLNRILGADFATVYLNEASEIDSYRVVQRIQGRLRQKVTQDNGKPLVPKLFIDCNPPSKLHWTYKVFRLGVHPLKGTPLKNASTFAQIKMNTEHNLVNLSEGYMDGMDYDYKEHEQFVSGEWYDEVDNPLFYGEDIAQCRLPPRLPQDAEDLVQIVVAIDPAITAKEGSDETGIMVVGCDDEGHGYVLEDLSGVYTPYQWAEVACPAFDRWKADRIVAERNQGGDMVAATIRTAKSTVPVTLIHASRGKEIRAESTSTAYRQKRVHHCGEFPELESQLLNFETGFDRRRKGSPDRLDALVHGFNAILFGEKVKRGGGSQLVADFWR